MPSGRIDWGVDYSSIMWFEKQFFKSHKNVIGVTRSNKLVFTVDRRAQSDHLRVLLVSVYVFGVADDYFKAKVEFPNIDCIVQAGRWNKFTPDAIEQAAADGIGLFTPSELYTAIWKE